MTPIVAHVCRQLRFGLSIAQLGQNVVDIRVGLKIEIDEHAHQAVVGVDRIHVVHVIHAAHLLLDRGGHGLFDRLRIGADVIGLNENLRRNDFGELRDRQSHHRHQTDNDHDDGDHHGDDRAG